MILKLFYVLSSYTQDGVVAEQYSNRPKEYEQQARQWVQEYAQEGMITEKEIMVLLVILFEYRLTMLLREVRTLIMFILYSLVLLF